MKLLAIDTTGGDCSVALWEEGHEVSFREKTAERDQAALLPFLVKDVIGREPIDQILVNKGPGSFTGIRVGISFAKGLAMGWDVPLVGMDSFTATYTSLVPAEDVWVLIDARRPDVFAQRFLNGVPYAPQTLTRYDLEQILEAPHPPVLAGSGLYPLLEGLVFEEAISPWKGAQKLAYTFFKKPDRVSDPLPFYLREADVSCAVS